MSLGVRPWRLGGEDVGLDRQCYYMLGTATKLSMPFQVLGVVNTPVFLGLGVTVTESKIKKVQKQDLKTLKM